MTKPDFKEFNAKYNLLEREIPLLKYAKNVKSTTALIGKPSNFFLDYNRRFFKNIYTIIALIVLLIIVLMAFIIPAVSPYVATAPISNALNQYVRNLPPSSIPNVTRILAQGDVDFLSNLQKTSGIHFINSVTSGAAFSTINYNAYKLLAALGSPNLVSYIGTDGFGRDLWLTSWEGTRDAFGLAIGISVFSFLIGVTIGAYVGFHVGKWVDTLFLRTIEIINSVPGFLMLIILVGILGQSTIAIMLILIVLYFTGPLYLTRTYIITIKDEEFLHASKAVGSSKFRVIYFEALPQILGKLLNSLVISLIGGITVLATLAFLGVITDQDSASSPPNLGLILNSSRNQIDSNIWAMLLPTFILVILTISLRFIAIGIHDALDSRVKDNG